MKAYECMNCGVLRTADGWTSCEDELGRSCKRRIFTRAELRAHKVDSHGRDYNKSDDGWSDMEVAADEKWHAVSGWGRDGWDLGDWPYVVISVRTTLARTSDTSAQMIYEMRQTVEGDTDIYRFACKDDRNAAIDYLFIWYGIGNGYDEWVTAGLSNVWDAETCDYPARAALDAGTLRVPDRFRGPFSWERLEADKAVS